MIDTIEIKNFKSIVDLTINLGRFNVIIGANGCGKTNILEAITFASAASQNKLDTASLINRDIRVPDFQYMFNAFEDQEENDTGFLRSDPVGDLTGRAGAFFQQMQNVPPDGVGKRLQGGLQAHIPHSSFNI